MSAVLPSGSAGAAHLRRARVRVALLAFVLSAVGLLLLGLLALDARQLSDDVMGLGVAKGPALAGLGAILVVLMFPASLVAGAAGYACGVVGGTLVALVACAVGAGAAAALGRAVGTPVAREAFGARILRFVTWAEARPARSVMLARLLPGAPFNALSYALGLTRIRLVTIVGGSAIGYAPRCFAYAALGGSLSDLDDPNARWAVAAGVVLTVAVVLVPRLAYGRLETAIDEETRRG